MDKKTKKLEKLTNIIESILYVSGAQVAISDISEKLGVTDKEIKDCAKILQEKYSGNPAQIPTENGPVLRRFTLRPCR